MTPVGYLLRILLRPRIQLRPGGKIAGCPLSTANVLIGFSVQKILARSLAGRNVSRKQYFQFVICILLTFHETITTMNNKKDPIFLRVCLRKGEASTDMFLSFPDAGSDHFWSCHPYTFGIASLRGEEWIVLAAKFPCFCGGTLSETMRWTKLQVVPCIAVFVQIRREL